MYCKDCLSFGVCRYASGSRLLEKEPCADFMEIDKWVKLPCKVGDTLYEPTDRGTISEYRVTAIRVGLLFTFVEWDITNGFAWRLIDGICANEIGKTVFLSREEAERALKERESNEK